MSGRPRNKSGVKVVCNALKCIEANNGTPYSWNTESEKEKVSCPRCHRWIRNPKYGKEVKR